MKNICPKSAAFSLVELIVAVAITGILFLGVSVFFTQHLGQLNDLSHQSENIRSHFILQEMLRKKFIEAQSVMHLNQDYVILENNPKAQTPFSVLGTENNKVVLKDFFPMRGISAKSIVSEFDEVKGATDMTYLDPYYYLSVFGENAVYLCDQNKNCDLFADGISGPLGLSHSTTHIFVTEAKTGKILKIDKQNAASRSTISDDFEQPAGVAYYQNSQGDEFLFVSDPKANVVKRIDLQNNQIQIAAGLGNDFSCSSSGPLCALKMPTDLAIAGETLYIADTGNGRILKISEPQARAESPTDMKLEFEIDPQIALKKFILTGNFEGEVFDPQESNVAGNENNYNAQSKIFTNAAVETAPINDCKMSQNMFSSISLESKGFKVNDFIGIDGGIYKILGFKGQKNCQKDPEEDPILRYETEVNPKPAGKDAFFAYGANYSAEPNSGKVTLAFDHLTFNQSGFQKIKVETEDFEQGIVVESDEILIRVGDGTLGSQEDTVEIWAEGLTYPNALSVEE